MVTPVLHEATHAGHQRLQVHASITARPAFERFGFTVDAARLVEINGQMLRNFDMSISLPCDDGEGHSTPEPRVT